MIIAVPKNDIYDTSKMETKGKKKGEQEMKREERERSNESNEEKVNVISKLR